MKNSTSKIALFILCFLCLVFSRCSLFETDIDGELSTTLPVNESKKEVDITYKNTMIISADSDKDIKDNLSKIKNWSVLEISYSIWAFSGDDPNTTFTGNIGFSRRAESTPSITASVSNLKFANISDDKKKHKVSLSEVDLAKIANIFDTDQALKVYWDGVLSHGPMQCSIEVFAKVKVKAKVL